ncbi:hypothetical protein ACYJ1Y_09295 [Natrialbaceae archaeon A-gly3]
MSTDTTSETETETDRTARRTRTLSRVRSLARDLSRIVGDVVTVGLWVLLVTLLALAGGWSRLEYYALLALGVVCYVLITVEYEWGRQ